MTALGKIIKKFYSSYLSSRLVLAMDIVISTIASVFSLCLVLIFTGRDAPHGWEVSFAWLVLALLSSALFLYLFRCYRTVIRHMTLLDVGRYCLASICKSLLPYALFLAWMDFDKDVLTLAILDFLLTFTCLMAVRFLMVLVYDGFRNKALADSKRQRILIYGTRNKASSLVTRLANSEEYYVVGLISRYPESRGSKVADKKIYWFPSCEEFKAFVNSHGVTAVLFAHEKDARQEKNGLVSCCMSIGVKVLLAPSIDEVVDGKLQRGRVREIKIEDLLGRSEIRVNLGEIEGMFGGKTVLVTGAAGSIGSELVRQLATFGVKKLVLFDNAETPMHNLRLELEERFPSLDFVPVIGDVRQVSRLDYAFRRWRPQAVFHAAAYKHVPLMEENPCEAVLVNVGGSRNVADKCIEYGVERMVMVSTDKAVNPTNVMGCTKRLAEIYVQSLGLAVEGGNYVMPEGAVVDRPVTKFVTTRFGNVLGSNGSVIPRFRGQIEKGGPLTVTHPDMVRFFMTIPEACRLVLEAATLTSGNEIFVFDMGEPVKIDQLARKMISLAGFVPDKDIKIEYVGLRPGEKLYEEVLCNAENTLPTNHERIRVANVREYDYNAALEGVEELTRLSMLVEIPDMIRLMKKMVPEYKSRNSEFEKYDATGASDADGHGDTDGDGHAGTGAGGHEDADADGPENTNGGGKILEAKEFTGRARPWPGDVPVLKG